MAWQNLSTGRFALARFGVLLAIAAAAAALNVPYASAAFPAKMIATYQSLPKQIAAYAYDLKLRLNSKGLAGHNENGWLRVGFQHSAMVAMTLAAAYGDRKAVDRLWPAVDQAFAHQKPNGSFEMAAMVDGHPTRIADEPTSDAFFMADLIPALLILKTGPLADAYKDRLQALEGPILRAAIFMARPDSQHAMLFHDTPAADRLFVDAKALIFAGYYTKAAEVISAGHRILNVALSLQRPDGDFLEKSGSDSSYNAISLLHLTEIAVFLNEPQLMTALRKGFNWEEGRVNSNGSITVEGNTRTGASQEIYFGKPKGVHYREITRAFALYGTFANDQAAADTALKITNYALAHQS